MASVSLKNIYKIYEGNVQAVSDFTLDIEDKEFIVLVGPSGCGKSTTLRMVAGLEEISSGELYIGDQLMNDIPPKDRDIAMVFQSYALYPHMTVYDNMAFGLKLRKMPKDEIDRRVKEAAQILGIEGYLNRKPKALSGGQRQRVALGRAIVRDPKVFLMDEPLSNLDAKLRVTMRAEIAKLHQRLQTTFIYVTHDQEEALTMADTICVLKDGRIQQIGTPEDIYNEPKNAFVADFIGESNIVDAIMKKDRLVNFHGRDFECVDEGFEKNEPVDVVLRPEDIVLTAEDDPKAMLQGEVVSLTFKGVHYEMWVQLGEDYFLIQSTEMFEVGSRVGVYIRPDLIHVMKRSEYSNEYDISEVLDNLWSEEDDQCASVEDNAAYVDDGSDSTEGGTEN